MLKFIEPTHTYELDGEVLKSATQIVQELFNAYANVPEAILEKAAEKGTAVHKDLEELVKGEKPLAETEEGELIYNEVKRLELEPLYVEQPIYANDEIKVAGTPDLIAKRKSEIILVDYKTTSSRLISEWSVQLNLYRYMIEKYYNLKVDKMMILRPSETIVLNKIENNDLIEIVKGANK